MLVYLPKEDKYRVMIELDGKVVRELPKKAFEVATAQMAADIVKELAIEIKFGIDRHRVDN